jgi:hypothetical protein
MNSLFAITWGARSGKMSPLHATTEAVASVIRYLQFDPVSVQLGLNTQLKSLLAALNDTLQGAKPPLFFSEQGRVPGGGPVSGHSSSWHSRHSSPWASIPKMRPQTLPSI